MKLKTFLGLFAFLSATAPAFAENVIFITIDGVRPQDAKKVFREMDAYSYPVRVSNRSALSLPGYRALFTGDFEVDCTQNSCSNIDRDTLIDQLVDQGLPLNKIAAISSWNGTGFAIESKPRIFRSIAGITSGAVESIHPHLLAMIDAKNARGLEDAPEWIGAIKDQYTWSIAMDYLETNLPKFLYIGLLDTDEWAHKSQRKLYMSELRLLRERIENLQLKLSEMGEYGKETTIVLATDHGRGNWPFRAAHGKSLRQSFKAWARIFPSEALKESELLESLEISSQVDIRPAIESILGLTQI